ncbi:MAG: DUF5658 family protein [Candidatus Woesearchaeota archaeon]|nr:DUF5658 family protein [Candidatus Woesearchaeota archaeon]
MKSKIRYLYVFSALFIFDVITTLINNPASEINPIIKALWLKNPLYMLLFKLFLLLIIAGAYAFALKFGTTRQINTFHNVLKIGIVAYVIIAILNILNFVNVF